MNIVLLHTKDCHAWQEAEKALEDALLEAEVPVGYQVKLVATLEDVNLYRFVGSPQIMINGKDLDPPQSNFNRYSLSSCRLYKYNGHAYHYPTKEMIVEAIRRNQ